MLEGKTSSGFAYSIPEEKLSDWRIIKRLTKLKNIKDDGPDAALTYIGIMAEIEELLFDDGGDAFEENILKANDGAIAPAIALKELLEILTTNQTTKNS